MSEARAGQDSNRRCTRPVLRGCVLARESDSCADCVRYAVSYSNATRSPIAGANFEAFSRSRRPFLCPRPGQGRTRTDGVLAPFYGAAYWRGDSDLSGSAEPVDGVLHRFGDISELQVHGLEGLRVGDRMPFRDVGGRLGGEWKLDAHDVAELIE